MSVPLPVRIHFLFLPRPHLSYCMHMNVWQNQIVNFLQVFFSTPNLWALLALGVAVQRTTRK